jgi:dynein heavy chain
MLFANADCCKNAIELIRLWVHESSRVYRDKLIDRRDMDMFDKIQRETVKTCLEEFDDNLIFRQPLLYCNFAAGIGDAKYLPVSNYADLYKILSEALDNHNELNAAMNLVLFEDAVSHVLRINRILEAPRGNALLIGVGGSGKQSLSRLAAFIASLEVFQITLKKGYDVTDLKADLAALYMKAGTKNLGIVFLMTDAQVMFNINFKLMTAVRLVDMLLNCTSLSPILTGNVISANQPVGN